MRVNTVEVTDQIVTGHRMDTELTGTEVLQRQHQKHQDTALAAMDD